LHPPTQDAIDNILKGVSAAAIAKSIFDPFTAMLK
jgi:hypothetical protein